MVRTVCMSYEVVYIVEENNSQFDVSDSGTNPVTYCVLLAPSNHLYLRRPCFFKVHCISGPSTGARRPARIVPLHKNHEKLRLQYARRSGLRNF